MKPQRGKTPKKTPRKTRQETDPVQVYCRVRPLSNPDDESCLKVTSSLVRLLPPETSHAFRNGTAKETEYSFQNVFHEYTTQKSLFDHVALPLVEDVLHGKNALLFAYGITSSGKTYTMTGSPQDQGILPRCLDVMFNSIKELLAKKYVFKADRMNGFDVQPEADAMLERQQREILPRSTSVPKTPGRYDWSKVQRIRDPTVICDVEEDNNYSVFVSYIEIYNNYVYDLLEDLTYNPISGVNQPTSKTLREDNGHNMYVSNCVEVEVKSTEDVYQILNQGQNRRRVAHTALNTESSRSHSVFNIRLVQGPLDPAGEEVLQDKDKICISQLALVDLAGSERTGRTQNAGVRLREAGNINQSLMVLRTCIECLRENQKNFANKMVPYRDSRLTHLFKNYFDGEGKVRMIVCVNPKAEEYDETMQVMRFAEMTQEVEVARPQQVRFDVGLTPGRRRRNKEFHDALAEVDPLNEHHLMPAPIIYTMGERLPPYQLTDPGDDITLSALITSLQARELRRGTLLTDFAKKQYLFRKRLAGGYSQDAFRTRLLNIDSENVSLKRKVEELESALTEKDLECNRTSKRLRSMEKSLTMLQRTTNMYEQEKKTLEQEIDTREWKIMHEKTEKDRLRQDYHAKLTLHKQQFNRAMDVEKRNLKETASHQVRVKQQKLDLLKNILNNGDTTDIDSVTSTESSSTSTVPKSRWQQAQAARSLAKSTPDLSTTGHHATRSSTVSTPVITSRFTHQRAMTMASSRTGPPVKPKPTTSRAGRPKTPPPLKPKPIVNPRGHRRSKSSHEIWLDHRPVGTFDTGTLLQPKMKKRRSVTKLTEKDTKMASKYVLTTQHLDSEGEVATQLVKGNILPTAGGGTAVLFTDVETLKQAEPGDRQKRYKHLSPADFEGEWSDAEDRCRIAIEGHGLGKRAMMSQV